MEAELLVLGNQEREVRRVVGMRRLISIKVGTEGKRWLPFLL